MGDPRAGPPVAEQLPIIDLLPGDSGYNDFVAAAWCEPEGDPVLCG